MASTRLPTDKSLHPEIRSIVSLATAHTQKVYFSGPLVYTFERRPDGCLYYEDNKGGDWRNVWAQLSGTTLSIWDTGERKMVRQPRVGKHPSSSVNVTEPVSAPFLLHCLRDSTKPSSPGRASSRYWHNKVHKTGSPFLRIL
jgi:CCR4-NOT transcriptional complex subunit CAF120